MNAKLFSFLALWLMLLIPSYKLGDVYQFETTRLTGDSLLLGKDNLYSPKMTPHHLRLEVHDHTFAIYDLSPTRRVTVKVGDSTVDVASFSFKPGQETTVQLNDSLLKIKVESNERILIDSNYGNWVFDGALVSEKSGILPSCRGPYKNVQWVESVAKLRAKVERLIATKKRLNLGGTFNCATQVAVPGATYASIEFIKGVGWILTSRTPERVFISDPQNKWHVLSKFTLYNSGIFTAGVSSYKAKLLENGVIELEVIGNNPISKVAVWPSHETWRLMLPSTDFAVLNWKRFAVIVCAVSFLYLLSLYGLGRRLAFSAKLYLFFASACFISISAFAFEAVRFPFVAYIGLFSLLCALAVQRKLHYIFLLALGVGTINQLILCLNSGTNELFVKFNEQIVLVSLFSLAVLWAKVTHFSLINIFSSALFPYLVKTFGAVLAGLMLVHVIFGSETGMVGFINPAELLKAALAFIIGYLLSQMLPFQRSFLKRSIRELLVIVPTVVLLTGLYLMSLADHSPFLILLAMWLGAFIMCAQVFNSRDDEKLKRFFNLVAAFLLVMFIGLIYCFYSILSDIKVDTFSSAIPALERIKSYLYPENSLINGYQLNAALSLLSESKWYPSDWETPINIPAIHNDFAITHAIYKLGKFPVLLVIGLISAFCIYSILNGVVKVHRLINNEGLFSERMPRLALQISSVLLATALLTHSLITLGSNTSLLPVMGQPMFMLSLANSHLIFWAIAICTINSALEDNYV